MVSYIPFWLMSNRNYKLPKFQDFTKKRKHHAQNVIKINTTNQNILQKKSKMVIYAQDMPKKSYMLTNMFETHWFKLIVN
jgi:hypothetical protein